MALYLGTQKIIPFPTEYCSWFAGENPVFLYEANYNCSLEETADWPTYKSTWSTSARTIKFAATTYTTSANANVIYDRWGEGYHSGEALDFSKYSYVIITDTLLNMAYTSPEATLGKMHVVRSYRTGAQPVGQIFKFANGIFTVPTDSISGTTTYGATPSYHRQLLRNASNVLSVTDNATYGLWFTAPAPTFEATATHQCKYINFKTPTLQIRGNNSYLVQDAFNAIDGENCEIKIRQRFYRINQPGVLEKCFTKLATGLQTGNLPTELI